MSGGNISCGSFRGEDKSGSAIQGLLAGIASLLSGNDADQYKKEILDFLTLAVEQANDYIEISPELAAKLRPPLQRYYEHLAVMLGHPHPRDAPAADNHPGLDPVAAKWGDGIGWQYYCAHDLIRACDASARSSDPIFICFN